MNAERIASAYLDALEKGDADAVLALFRPDAIVHSPLYGPVPAGDFYPRLFSDTGRSALHLRGVTHGRRLIGIWFRYDWSLPSGAPADFECVDILELDDEGLIRTLRIFYDTVSTRAVFEQETGGSWRPGPR